LGREKQGKENNFEKKWEIIKGKKRVGVKGILGGHSSVREVRKED